MSNETFPLLSILAESTAADDIVTKVEGLFKSTRRIGDFGIDKVEVTRDKSRNDVIVVSVQLQNPEASHAEDRVLAFVERKLKPLRTKNTMIYTSHRIGAGASRFTVRVMASGLTPEKD